MDMRPICLMVVLALAAVEDRCNAPAPLPEIPRGTELHLRLATQVGSGTSQPGEPITAVVIAPVVSGNHALLQAGSKVHGTVRQAQTFEQTNARATLELWFDSLEGRNGARIQIAARVVLVDNARETIDDSGRILGILPSQALTTRIDEALARVGERYQNLAAVLMGAKKAFVKEAQPEIDYPVGTEMTIRLS